MNFAFLISGLVYRYIFQGGVILKILNKVKKIFKNIFTACPITGTTFRKIKSIIIKDTIRKRIKLERKRIGINKKTSFNLYIPSIYSGILPIIIVAIFYLISYIPTLFTSNETPYPILNYIFINNEVNSHQNIISIHAGIGIIIFALIIFMAESMRGSNRKDRALVFLKESFIFPITVAEIFVFFAFIFGPINFVSYLMVIGLGIAVIFSLGRTFKILLYPELLHKKTIEIYKIRLIQPIDAEINNRIGNWVLSNIFKKNEVKLKHNPYFDRSRIDYRYFKCEEEGIVYDINLTNLEKIGNLIEKEANKNNYYWDPIIKKDVNISKKQSSKHDAKNTEQELKIKPGNGIDKERFLVIGYKSFINQDNNIVFAINKRLLKDPGVILKIKTLIPNTFKIKSIDTFRRDIDFELANLKDQFIDAIQKKHIGEIKELKEVYVSIFENFLEYFKKFNIIHSFQRARQERSNIFGGWKEIESLNRDIFDIFEKAMETEDRRVIFEVKNLPNSIVRKSILFHDHYFFQEFIKFSEYLYEYAKKVTDPELEELLIDHTWRTLKELVEFNLLYKITNNYKSRQELESFRDFIIDIILIYQNLIRSTILRKDLKSFHNILSSFKDLFSDYYDFKISKKFDGINKNNFTMIEDEKRKKILEYEENLKRIYYAIDIKKNQFYIGLSSWLLNEIIINKRKDYQEFYEKILDGITNNLDELFKIFIDTINPDIDHFWGWTHWVLPADGKVHSVNFDYYIYQLFCVKSLKIINMKSISGKEGVLPFDRQLSYLAEDNSRLMMVLKDMETNKDKWNSVLNEQEIDKLDVMKIILKNIKKKQDEKDRKIVINKSISQIKIEEFKKEVIDIFYKNASIREILMHYNLYLNKLNTKKTDMQRLGINRIDDKEAFFDDWHIGYQGCGAGYGRDLAFGENLDLFRKIIKSCKKIDIEDFNEKINNIKNMEEMIIIADIHSVSSFFHGNKNYVPSYHKNCPKKDINLFKGIYRTKKSDIRIYEVFLRKINNNILLLNYEKLGKLIQLTPLGKDDDESNITDIFYISIKAFSENFNILEKFIKNPPKWLEDIGNEVEQRKYLIQKVLVHIFERYEFTIDREFEGYLFKVKNSE